MHPLRPWASRACHRAFLRSISTTAAENPVLESEQDWTAFQATRASFKTLSDSLSQYGSAQTRGTTWKLRDGLHKPVANATTSALLAAGAHFGHASSRLNPNFMPYAYGTRAGITIIDLDHTLPLLKRAANLVRAVAVEGGQVVFLGTRPDLRPIVEKAAERMGRQGYHVGDRWLPGTLTNKWKTFGHETVRGERVIPDLVVILNPLANMSAIHECALLHIPTIGIVDSNVDPRIVMYPIPANDESTRTAEIVAGVLSIAGREGATVWEMSSRQGEDEMRKEDESEGLRYGDSRLDV
ncbi:hypothetical protein VNI00_008262 [Paramarasmius palmivorus]|uniref:Ribosomal protein S2 n=1 Tax=Paramarasmius palmivorus TaxID=297713 RepID=A0AAW0CX52_9AGAR